MGGKPEKRRKKRQTDITASAVDFKVASYADFFFSYSALAISVASLYGCETGEKEVP